MLQLLHYTYKEEKTGKIISPLQIAFENGNHRSVDIILRYMAKISFNASDLFCSIFPDLLEFDSFFLYLETLSF